MGESPLSLELQLSKALEPTDVQFEEMGLVRKQMYDILLYILFITSFLSFFAGGLACCKGLYFSIGDIG